MISPCLRAAGLSAGEGYEMEIVVASDGSSDATAQIVGVLIPVSSPTRLRLFDYPENRPSWRFLTTPFRSSTARSWSFPMPSACLSATHFSTWSRISPIPE
jgi:hypothetical protein